MFMRKSRRNGEGLGNKKTAYDAARGRFQLARVDTAEISEILYGIAVKKLSENSIKLYKRRLIKKGKGRVNGKSE